jgi:hypothetical protein
MVQQHGRVPGQWQGGGGFVTVLSASIEGHSYLGSEC